MDYLLGDSWLAKEHLFTQITVVIAGHRRRKQESLPLGDNRLTIFCIISCVFLGLYFAENVLEITLEALIGEEAICFVEDYEL